MHLSFIHVNECVSVWESVTCVEVPCGASKGGMSDPLELELYRVVNCLVGMLVTNEPMDSRFLENQ